LQTFVPFFLSEAAVSLYFIAFLEGLITFISPCLLPMLPVYITYFAGGGNDAGAKKTAARSLGFVLGFTIIFIFLGAFAGFLGGVPVRHRTAVNVAAGAVVVVFGLGYLNIIKIKFFNRARAGAPVKVTNFFTAVLFGAVFSVSWTPCVGAFLGSALMLASRRGSAAQGVAMLLCYSMGLGVPFFLSAVLIENLKSAFNFIKKHYTIINAVSGVFLIALGVLMATGAMGALLTRLAT